MLFRSGVNSETPNGTITYSYTEKAKMTNLFGMFATKIDGLPTDAGVYTVTAHIAANGNYAAADSANTLELTIEKSTPSIVIDTVNGKTYDCTAVSNPAAGDMTIRD